jgi:AraC-like DNA-binding protein
LAPPASKDWQDRWLLALCVRFNGRLEADLARTWTVREIAAACEVPPRTLQRQFRRFMGQMPMAFVRDLRLDRARIEMLRVCGDESVTEIAVRCGFTHLGRFAASYRARYGESPSATLHRHQNVSAGGDTRPVPLNLRVERPAIAVLPFDLAASVARLSCARQSKRRPQTAQRRNGEVEFSAMEYGRYLKSNTTERRTRALTARRT